MVLGTVGVAWPHLDPAMDCEAAVQLLRSHVQRAGLQQGALQVVAPLFVALADTVEEVRRLVTEPAIVKHQAVARDVIEQRGGVFEKQWQVVLDTTRHLPLTDAAVDQAALRIAFDLFPVGGAKARDGLLVDGKLACRQQRYPVDFLAGALGLRVEDAD